MKNLHTALAVALTLAAVTASAAPAQKSVMVTGSLIPVPLDTVVVRTPTMAFIRKIAIKPLVRPMAGGRCEVEGAVYSDVTWVADGPMPNVPMALVNRAGQRINVVTNDDGIYRTTVPAGNWRESRPEVGSLPFGVHASRPRVRCQ